MNSCQVSHFRFRLMAGFGFIYNFSLYFSSPSLRGSRQRSPPFNSMGGSLTMEPWCTLQPSSSPSSLPKTWRRKSLTSQMRPAPPKSLHSCWPSSQTSRRRRPPRTAWLGCPRHTNLRDLLYHTAFSSALGPTREDRALIPETEARPADVLIPKCSGRRDTHCNTFGPARLMLGD